MRELTCHIKRLAIVPALAGAMIVTGCGPGVELSGPGFEALGLKNKAYVEKKVPDRAPLLIPPNRTRLPEPAPQVATVRPENWPTDPDSVLRAEDLAAAKKQQEYEDKGDWSKNADIDEFEKIIDPTLRKRGVFDRKNNKPLADKYRDFKKYEN